MVDELIEDRKVRRGRWLRWVWICLVVLVALVATLRIFWGYQAEAMVRRELAAIKARGEPIYWRDFAPKPIPDSENAAELYKQAARLSPYNSSDPRAKELMELDSALLFRDFRREHQAELAELVAMAQPSLELCRQAKDRKQADWKLDYGGTLYGTGFPSDLSGHRVLAKLLLMDAYLADQQGDHARAAESLLAAASIGDRVSQCSPTVIAHLVSIACDAWACSGVEELAPRLRSSGEHAASAAQLRELIRRLLDEGQVQASFARCWQGERTCNYEMSEAIRHNRDEEANATEFKIMRICFPQLLAADEVFLMRHMSAYHEAGKASDYPAFMAKVPAAPAISGAWLDSHMHPLRNMLMPTLTKAGELHFRALAMRRMAAAALALRLYEVEHGRRPEKLAELVGKYISAVPVDPFDPNGGPIRYLPGATPPLLYSVHNDGRDDGGSYKLQGGGVSWDSIDQVWFLDGDRPEGPPRIPASLPAAASMPASFPFLPPVE